MTVVVPYRKDKPADERQSAARDAFALAEQAQAGDPEAFGMIYKQNRDVVFRFVYFRVGNKQLAEDLTQDVFVRAFRRISSFEWQEKHVAAWLVTIARNLVADHFKSGRYRCEVLTGDMLDEDKDTGLEGRPASAVADHMNNLVLLAAVKLLSRDQFECVKLRYLQGLSVRETAAEMRKEEGAVKALQYRAIRTLARLVGDELWDGAGPRPGLVPVPRPAPVQPSARVRGAFR